MRVIPAVGTAGSVTAILCGLVGGNADRVLCAPRPSETGGALPGIAAIEHRVHIAGNIYLTVTNIGLLGSTPGSSLPWSTAPSAEWPKGSGVEYLWAMGPWFGGMKEGVPAVTTAAYQVEVRPDAGELDVIYMAREGTPGGRRYPSPNADDDEDGRVDEDWLDGRDNDGDGAIDEDFAAASDEMFYCEYNDADPNIRLALPEHNPIGLLVHQRTMVWQNPLQDDFVGISYTFVNRGVDPLFDVHLGMFADFDIGLRNDPSMSEDDFAGFWEGVRMVRSGNTGVRNVKLSIGYMFDDDGDFGAADGYVGLAFLGARRVGSGAGANAHASLSNFRMFAGSLSFQEGGQPTNDEERLQTLAGKDPFALPPADPISGLRPPRMSSRADDHRIVLSAGPFDVVNPGDSLVADFALVIGPGFDGMLQHAAQAKLVYDGAWFDRDGDPLTGIDGRETPVCGPESAGLEVRVNACDESCDTTPGPHCFETVPSSGCVWVNADCELERFEPRTGVEGREHQVRWYADMPTPVALADFAATSSTAGVQLRWSMSVSSLRDATAVFVRRSESASGPFVSITPIALPPLEVMTFEDDEVEPGRSYWYRLLLAFADGTEEHSHAIRVDVDAAGRGVSRLDVSQPDSDAVEIDYWIAGAPVAVRVRIFDVAGREVRSWDEGRREGGAHRIAWDRTSRSGKRVAKGIYIVHLQAGDEDTTRKLVLVRP